MMNNINTLRRLVDRYRQAMQEQADLQKFISYAITYHSTAIEGSTLTEEQVYNLLDLDIPAQNKPLTEQQMVTDHQKALIFTLNEAKAHTPLTETLIRQIGAMAVKNTSHIYSTILGTFDGTRGEYRLLNAYTGVQHFPDCIKVPALMKTLVREINDEIGKVQTFSQKCELAFELHYRFVSIHPFADGNGQTSRLLMNYILAMFKLPVFYVFKSNRSLYLQALKRTQATNNISIFHNFMYQQYQKFLEKDL